MLHRETLTTGRTLDVQITLPSASLHRLPDGVIENLVSFLLPLPFVQDFGLIASRVPDQELSA